MELLQWGCKEKRILKHVQNMKSGDIVESAKVAKAVNTETITVGRIIALLLHEKQLNIRRIKNDSSNRQRYEVL